MTLQEVNFTRNDVMQGWMQAQVAIGLSLKEIPRPCDFQYAYLIKDGTHIEVLQELGLKVYPRGLVSSCL